MSAIGRTAADFGIEGDPAMTKEHAGAWTCTSRVIRARPEELYAAFLDPAALVDWLPPARMTGEIHEFDARVGDDIGCRWSTPG